MTKITNANPDILSNYSDSEILEAVAQLKGAWDCIIELDDDSDISLGGSDSDYTWNGDLLCFDMEGLCAISAQDILDTLND